MRRRYLKINRKQKLMILILLLVVSITSVGFAAFSTTLEIKNATAVVQAPDNPFLNGLVLTTTEGNGTVETDTWTLPNIELTSSNRNVTYTATVTNNTAYDAFLKSISAGTSKITCSAAAGESVNSELLEEICNSLTVSLSINDASVQVTKTRTVNYAPQNASQVYVAKNGGTNTITITISASSEVRFPDGDVTFAVPAITMSYSSIRNTVENTFTGDSIGDFTNGTLAIFVEDEDGEYYSSGNVPTSLEGNYELNTTLSHCINGGIIGEYDASSGEVEYTITKSDKCYLYFDIETTSSKLNDTIYALAGNSVYDSLSSPDGNEDLSTEIQQYQYFLNLAQTDPTNETVTGLLDSYGLTLEEGIAYLSSEISELQSIVSDSKKYVVKQEYGSDNEDAGIRYEGYDPDNYVCFDNGSGACNTTIGTFRIIGIQKGSTIGLTGDTYYTKVIKTDSLGDMEWNSNNINEWVNASLDTYLNGTYLTSISGISGKIITPTYYLGGVSSDDYEVFTSSEYYTNERGTTVYSGRSTSISNKKIALMYPSDYGFAAYGSSCNNKTTELYNYNYGCFTVDWLYAGTDQWTLTPCSDSVDLVYGISGTGSVYYASAGGAYAVRPVFYLDSSVEITGGNGTSASPYIID